MDVIVSVRKFSYLLVISKEKIKQKKKKKKKKKTWNKQTGYNMPGQLSGKKHDSYMNLCIHAHHFIRNINYLKILNNAKAAYTNF